MSKRNVSQMPVKKTLKSITNKLDNVVRKIVRLRDEVCVTCGFNDTLQVSHYISRTHISTRWSLVNCNLQCASCHLRDFHGGFVVNYQKYLISKHGDGIIESLENEGRKLACDVGLSKYYQREELFKSLSQQLKEFEKNV